MKVKELIKIGKEIMKMLHERGIKMEDYQYLPLVEEFDTITHELKHTTEHISGYFGVDPKSEEAAYLQGEIAKKMFPAVAIAVCPMCHDERDDEQ